MVLTAALAKELGIYAFRRIVEAHKLLILEIPSFNLQKLRTAAVRYVDAVERLNGTIDPSTGEKREPTIVSKIHLGDFLHGVKDVRNYLSYDGSFTSPERGCKEAIVWAVFADPLPIEEEVVIYYHLPCMKREKYGKAW